MKMQEGDIDPESYKSSLEEWIEADKELIKIYEKKGAKDHLGFIKKKLVIQQDELKELNEMEEEN